MPIFCDSGFIILSGLIKHFSSGAKVALSFISIVLATSLYSVHCLLPMHPGNLAAAGILNVNIGNLILVGTIYAVPAAVAAFYWTKWKTRQEPPYEENKIPEKTEIATQEHLPSVALSLLPVVAPLLFIALGSLMEVFSFKETNFIINGLIFLGKPVIALLMGVLLSFLLIRHKNTQVMLSKSKVLVF